LKRSLFPLDCGSQQYNSYYNVVLKYNTENWNKIQALKIASEDDLIDDGSQIVRIGIVKVETEDRHYSALTKANLNVSAIVINLDDDQAGALVTPTALKLEEGGNSKVFWMQLTSEPLDTVLVNFDISDSTVATLSKTQLTFKRADWDIRQQVKVSPVDDNIVSGDKESYIVFKTAISTDHTYHGLKLTDNIKIIMEDNDIARVNVASLEKTLQNSEAHPEHPAVVTVVLESIPKSSVVVTATLSNTVRGRMEPKDGRLMFTAQNWNRPQNINILPIDNDIDDGDAEYKVLFNVRSVDKSFDGQELDSMMVLTKDNDIAGVVSSTASNREGQRVNSISTRGEPGRRLNVYTSENGTVAFIDIALNSEPRANVEIFFYVDGSQYSGKTSSKKANEDFVGVASLTCESHGYSTIDNVKECAAAASDEGNNVIVQSSMDKPRGCYRDETADQLFMNKISTGRKIGDSKAWKLLCRSFSLVFTNSQGNSPWNKAQTIQIVPEDDDRVTTQQWALGRAVKSPDQQYNKLTITGILVQYDDNDVGINTQVFSKVTVQSGPLWNSWSGTLVLVIVVCFGLLVIALAIIFFVQRQNFKNKIVEQRQKLYQHRQRILSESSEHERSIVMHRSKQDEIDDDGNEFDGLTVASIYALAEEEATGKTQDVGHAKSATGKRQDVGIPADDLASMEVDYSSLVTRLVAQLKQLSEVNVDLAGKHGIDPVTDVEVVIQSGNPTSLFDKIREVKQSNLTMSSHKKTIKKPVSSSSIVPIGIE